MCNKCARVHGSSSTHLWHGQVLAQVGVHAVADDGEVRRGGTVRTVGAAVHHTRHHLPLLPLRALGCAHSMDRTCKCAVSCGVLGGRQPVGGGEGQRRHARHGQVRARVKAAAESLYAPGSSCRASHVGGNGCGSVPKTPCSMGCRGTTWMHRPVHLRLARPLLPLLRRARPCPWPLPRPRPPANAPFTSRLTKPCRTVTRGQPAAACRSFWMKRPGGLQADAAPLTRGT